MTDKPWLKRAGLIIAAVWIFGGAAFYFVRFSFVFYYANQAAIDEFFTHYVGRLN